MFITFDGTLKIGDFGLATRWPAPKGIDGEGDREYIAPESLNGQFDKPADIFSLGLIVMEIAGNFFLPDNGEAWQRLRSGDLSDVPSLTLCSDSQLSRDDDGNPVFETNENGASIPVYLSRQRDLAEPPPFMQNASHSSSLESLTSWIVHPNPLHRPTINQIAEAEGLQWVRARRRFGATVFEGNWGLCDAALLADGPCSGSGLGAHSLSNKGEGALDVEMEDV